MGTSVHLSTTRESSHEDREPFIHFLAREGRAVLRWVVIISLVATVVTAVSFWMAAIIPGLVLLVSYAALLLTREVEKRSEGTWENDQRTVEATEHLVEEIPDEVDPVQLTLVKRESKVGVGILVCVGVAALVLAVLAIFAGRLVPPQLLAIAALVLFAYMLLVMAPVWLGWIEDDIEDETHRIDEA